MCHTISAMCQGHSNGPEPAAPEAVQPPQVAKYCMPLSKPCARVGDITTAPIGKPLPMGFPSVTCRMIVRASWASTSQATPNVAAE